MSKHVWGLFERYGIELEYMICHKEKLHVMPIADQLIYKIAGEYVNDVCAGPITYSNELALHLIELKTTYPAADLHNLAPTFQEHVQKINTLLKEFDACLMPTGMHPWMDPFQELRLWTHGDNSIYAQYNKIFDCRGHGWANLQSSHLNLSFATDEELKELHSSIRWLLPIMPALSASSPIADGTKTPFLDTRLETYRHNQKKVPSIAGLIIPEPVQSKDEYFERILEPMWKDIAQYDIEGLLREEWLNSRGAIVRFDRNAIEIRVLDIQECPAMDLALIQAIVYGLEELALHVRKKTFPFDFLSTEDLSHIFLSCIRGGDQAIIDNLDYLSLFGCTTPMTASSLWRTILQPFWMNTMRNPPVLLQQLIVDQGPLARRIARKWDATTNHDDEKQIYADLCTCLEQGKPYGLP